MKIIEALNTFTKTISYLMKVPPSGKKLYIEKGEYILFKPQSFRTALSRFISGSSKYNKKIDEHLNIYKILGLISTDKDRTRFTKTQKIDSRVMKVVAVKKTAYELLLNMEKEEEKCGT
ncbi:hypothetical protein [Ruminiclostridium papyrosolvens]|uniref:Uncharacterized protein n=1 Tax=Ruminiclostridium papyrosolvens C7 TaxID=1330534 RepID=U4R1H4_9FIRM|nr:hypothetical protein [Ruminiclostridium papyrosolvens]EPR12063.1 hypothetical protein L323_09970 [Ruminiclostridium papyrosolvens C7]